MNCIHRRLSFLPPSPVVFVRLMLVRSDPNYQNVPVSRVCARHEMDVLRRESAHVLRVGREADGPRYSYVDGGDTRPNLCFPLIGINALDPVMYVSVICTDACKPNQAIPVATERSRAMVLCITLESFSPNMTLARRVMKVRILRMRVMLIQSFRYGRNRW